MTHWPDWATNHRGKDEGQRDRTCSKCGRGSQVGSMGSRKHYALRGSQKTQRRQFGFVEVQNESLQDVPLIVLN